MRSSCDHIFLPSPYLFRFTRYLRGFIGCINSIVTVLLQVASKEVWGYHTAKVNCVAWSPDSTLVASGSLDTSIIVWSVEKPAKRLIIKSKSNEGKQKASFGLIDFTFGWPIALSSSSTSF